MLLLLLIYVFGIGMATIADAEVRTNGLVLLAWAALPVCVCVCLCVCVSVFLRDLSFRLNERKTNTTTPEFLLEIYSNGLKRGTCDSTATVEDGEGGCTHAASSKARCHEMFDLVAKHGTPKMAGCHELLFGKPSVKGKPSSKDERVPS